jgi:tetratricopeptide (TPR) repeat protein
MLIIINVAFVGLHGSHTDIFFWPRYFLPAYLGLFVAACSVMLWSLGQMPLGMRKWGVLCLALLALVNTLMHYPVNHRRGNTLLRDYVAEVFAQLPANATLEAIGDNNLFPMLYFHLVEGWRSDINLVAAGIGYGDDRRALQDLQQGRYYTTHLRHYEEPWRAVVHGLVFHVRHRDESPPPPDLPWSHAVLEWPDREFAPLEELMLTSWAFRRALYHRHRGEERAARQALMQVDRYARRFDDALVLAGTAYDLFGEHLQAQTFFRKALEINPTHERARKNLAP